MSQRAVVRDERELIFDKTRGQFPVGLAIHTEMVNMRRLEAGAVSNSDQ